MRWFYDGLTKQNAGDLATRMRDIPCENWWFLRLALEAMQLIPTRHTKSGSRLVLQNGPKDDPCHRISLVITGFFAAFKISLCSNLQKNGFFAFRATKALWLKTLGHRRHSHGLWQNPQLLVMASGSQYRWPNWQQQGCGPDSSFSMSPRVPFGPDPLWLAKFQNDAQVSAGEFP